MFWRSGGTTQFVDDHILDRDTNLHTLDSHWVLLMNTMEEAKEKIKV